MSTSNNINDIINNKEVELRNLPKRLIIPKRANVYSWKRYLDIPLAYHIDMARSHVKENICRTCFTEPEECFIRELRTIIINKSIKKHFYFSFYL